MDRAFGRCAGPKKVQYSAHKEKGQQNVLLQQQWQHPMQPHPKRQRERTEAQQGKKAIGGTTTAMCDAARVCEVRKEGCTSSARPNNEVGPTPVRKDDHRAVPGGFLSADVRQRAEPQLDVSTGIHIGHVPERMEPVGEVECRVRH